MGAKIVFFWVWRLAVRTVHLVPYQSYLYICLLVVNYRPQSPCSGELILSDFDHITRRSPSMAWLLRADSSLAASSLGMNLDTRESGDKTPSGASSPPAKLWPQLSQNFAPARLTVSQLGHRTCSLYPQFSQKFAVSRYLCWQFGQFINLSLVPAATVLLVIITFDQSELSLPFRSL